MAQTFYAQGDDAEPTMTVGQLIARLQELDPSLPVCFRSPLYGCFGSHTAYTIDKVSTEILPYKEHHISGGFITDDETGDVYYREPETQVWTEWTGVIIE